jgi:hypothetical protein
MSPTESCRFQTAALLISNGALGSGPANRGSVGAPPFRSLAGVTPPV